jgi:hypothetical protein
LLDLSGRWRNEKLPGTRDIDLAADAVEQTVMMDAVEALRRNVKQEAAHELIGAERHNALAAGAITAIVLVAEGDSVLVKRD